MRWLNLVIIISICVVKCLGMSRSELEDFSNFLEITSQLDLNVKSKGPDEDYDEDEIVSDHAWEESGKFEGDLILNERQRRLIVADVAEGLARNGLQDSTKRWPNNEVIYYIQREHFSIGQVEAIQQGINDLAQASCVKFTPYKKGDRDAVVIQGSRRGCFSQVGYQGGYQVLNLSGRHPVGRGCFRHGTVVHELLHALGFYHMQSSPDRDDYIDVLWQNIVQQARHNFRKYNSFAVSDFGVGYDYESVLHYSRKAFSSNGQDTLVPKQSGAEIGQRVGMSQKDIEKLNKMYCDADSNDQSSDDDSALKKPNVSKKTSKNKPFDGHGIGYHQGKTVVIKIKPAVELHRLPTLPKVHMFDFSKAPQAMSPSLIEGSGNGVIHVPSTPSNLDEFYKPIVSKIITHDKDNVNGAEYVKGKPVMDNINTITQKNVLPLENTQLKDFSEGVIHDIGEEYEKLDAVRHIYPSFTDFSTDYSKYYNPEMILENDSKIAKVEKLFSSYSIPIIDDAYEPKKHTQFEMIPPEFQNNARRNEFKNMKQNTSPLLETREPLLEQIILREAYPLREKYYSVNESTLPNFETFTSNLEPKRNYSDGYYDYSKLENEDNNYSPFKDISLNEDWYKKYQYKQNPNNQYEKEAYAKLNGNGSEELKHTHDAEQSHIVKKYPVSEYNFTEDNQNEKPYLLFSSPVPFTQKWYKMGSTEHQQSHENYFDNGNR